MKWKNFVSDFNLDEKIKNFVNSLHLETTH
jgi:hypothetical protein